jgi:hypothetical protein
VNDVTRAGIGPDAPIPTETRLAYGAALQALAKLAKVAQTSPHLQARAYQALLTLIKETRP